MKIDLIIWDWNGTLLNDVEVCMDSMNLLLEKYSIPKITIEKYRDVFCFPVKDYYKKIGFDFEKQPFEKVGYEYIEIYNQNLPKSILYDNAIEILNYFSEKNIKQIIISAREKNALLDDVKFYNISNYFDDIIGIENHYGRGKEELFEKYFEQNYFDKKNVLLIGDTTHDFEIAQKFNINFIRFANGHQSDKHFSLFKIESITDLKLLADFLD
jgi:phosphoglycolate phosphatase